MQGKESMHIHDTPRCKTVCTHQHAHSRGVFALSLAVVLFHVPYPRLELSVPTTEKSTRTVYRK